MMEALGLAANEDAARKMTEYNAMLMAMNKKVNLTGIKDGEESLIKNIYDSMTVYDPAYFPQNGRVLDLGTGAGFPGVPLAILRPDMYVVLVDSIQKKLTFIEDACRELGIQAGAAQAGNTVLLAAVCASGLLPFGIDALKAAIEKYLPAKLQAFGFDFYEIDGHDLDAIEAALGAPVVPGKPRCILAHTVKGKGVSYMENQAGWHGKAPNAEQRDQALQELEG